MKETKPAKTKSYLLKELCKQAKIQIRYAALLEELEKTCPQAKEKIFDALGKLNAKEITCLELLSRQRTKFNRYKELGFSTSDIKKAMHEAMAITIHQRYIREYQREQRKKEMRKTCNSTPPAVQKTRR